MAAKIYREQRDCDRRLSQYFNSNRDQWIDVVKAMVAARGACTSHNPKASPGYFSWDAGITRMRQIFCREGWFMGDDDGIENISNHDFRRKVTVMNADLGVCDESRSPRNRTPKGSAAEKVTDLNSQLELFRREHPTSVMENAFDLWQLCVSDDGHTVLAEISKPIEFRSGYFVGYSERIWLIRPGEWERIAIESSAEPAGQDFEINVRRK